MRVEAGRPGILSLAALVACAAAAVASPAGGSTGSIEGAMLVAASSALLAGALGRSGRSPAAVAVTALVVLAALVLAVAVVRAAAGATPGGLSAMGAIVAFLVAPAACAYNLRTWRGFRAAVFASAAVPLIFIVSVVLDGPILQGAGPTIDAIDAATVPAWLLIVAANLVAAGPGG